MPHVCRAAAIEMEYGDFRNGQDCAARGYGLEYGRTWPQCLDSLLDYILFMEATCERVSAER
jgi:hypothetical protein